MNRKLIRPSLSEMKSKERDVQPPIAREQITSPSAPPRPPASQQNGVQPPRRPSPPAVVNNAGSTSDSNDNSSAAAGSKTRRAPSVETNAEIYYYKKQIDTHTTMVIVLQDNEEIEGTIEWYDRNALKVNRKNAPNIMLLKHNIKYMYKAEDRAFQG